MAKRIQSIRGMHDVLPQETPYWQRLESTCRRVLSAYGYSEIRLPVLEPTELFARSIGEVTDIVEKEMYTFTDRNGDSLSLRPEGTAGCVRAVVEHGLIHNQQQRLWYAGPMFRHERPQKGRYRQFSQIGVETFGFEGPDIDAELILLSARLWRALGLDGLRLEINSLGTPEARREYRHALVDYLRAHERHLDADARARLETNPMRVLDSKSPALQAVIEGAPSLLEYLDADSRAHYEGLKRRLQEAGIAYVENPRLVRGLDYYTRTVFEWVAVELGAQGTVCAGGRYDGLVEQLGGPSSRAAGFAMGLERLLGLMRAHATIESPAGLHAYLVMVGEPAERVGSVLAEALREALPGLSLMGHCGSGGFKAQLRRADRSGARFALILGEEEAQAGSVVLKDLRAAGEQLVVPQAELAERLRAALAL